MQAPVPKSNTANIVISEPDEDLLGKMLRGRQVSAGLDKFLRNLVKTKKWTRKINLPSSYDNAAVALVYASSLKETGLEIVTELHVFFDDKIIVEEWQLLGEGQKTAAVPKEAFTSMNIRKVNVENSVISVELSAPTAAGTDKIIQKAFDFATEEPRRRAAPHPLLLE